MQSIDAKLRSLGEKIDHGQQITILIVGLGSVGGYLLDYLIGLNNPRINLVVAGRNLDKMMPDVNIIKTAATIRRTLQSPIVVDGTCDLEQIDSIAHLFDTHRPDIVVNSSRVYSGLKYGSISWHHLRAYGIWTPLAVRYSRNIMLGYEQAGSTALVVNTSYSDAVVPWLKSAGVAYPDFGSGNLNHLIPRIKFAVAEQFSIENLNDIDVTIATSHFHDVVVSKEGHDQGVDVLLDVRHHGRPLPIDKEQIFRRCAIQMPTDQKRNMMNASSNFQIIDAILTALSQKNTQKIHAPGALGELGGYPVLVDGANRTAALDQTIFSIEEMREANSRSIALDGIEKIENAALCYTDKLVTKVKQAFGVDLPKRVAYADIDETAEFIIEHIIRPNAK